MDSIKESIIEGKYPIGSKLPTEVKLCEMLNVSRSTVREAMRSLQAEGFVELVAGKGTFILDNQGNDYDTIRTWFIESAPNLKDSTEVREALETLQVAKAIKRGTQQELDELKSIHQQFIEENKSNNVAALAALDEQFHAQICDMAHNALLSKINVLTAHDLRKYRYMSISVKNNSDNTIREHALIIRAIEERDTHKASAYMLAHLGSSLADINKVLEGQKDAVK